MAIIWHMGPSIILDKSALQSLGKPALRELARYFYRNTTPILLYEIIADLKKSGNTDEEAKTQVGVLSDKVMPGDSIVNMDYKTIAYANLIGEQIKMDRRPIVYGQTVVDKNGKVGGFVDLQPESLALLRWQEQSFENQDEEFAKGWRNAIAGMDWPAFGKSLRRTDTRPKDFPALITIVDALIAEPEVQAGLLVILLNELRLDPVRRAQIIRRWNFDSPNIYTLREFAPYAFHCARMLMMFYWGVTYEMLPTSKTVRLDLEYLFYAPFANIFCSGDKSHKAMKAFALGEDQTFIAAEDLKRELDELAKHRVEDPHIEPEPRSFIVTMWKKYLRGFAPQARPPRHISKEESDKTMKELAPMMEAFREAAKQNPDAARRFP